MKKSIYEFVSSEWEVGVFLVYSSIVAVLHQRVFILFFFAVVVTFFQLHTLLYVPKKMHEGLHK